MVTPFQSQSSAPAVADVTTRHRQWLDHAPVWSRLSDVMAGQDAVRRNARAYIPPSMEQVKDSQLYDAMISRTPYTNYTARCVDGIMGLIFRKEPSITVPDRFKMRLDNLNNAGENALSVVKKLVYQVVVYGRVGIYIDHLPTDQQRYDNPASLRPYLTMCTAQSIVNWRPRVIDGETVPDQIVLMEEYEEPDRFGSVTKIRYRVLELDESNNYRVQYWTNNAKTGDFEMSFQYYPTKVSNDGDLYLHRIPFVFVGPSDLGMNIQRSPILDIADANLSHYLLESYLSEALYYAAQPTPVISGWKEGMSGNFRFGGGNLWLLPEGCTASIMEFRGHGLDPQARAVAAKQEQIAELGTRLFASSASGPETAEAARIRAHGQTSVVSSIARTVSDGIKLAFEIACAWDRTEGKVEFELNQDYIDAMMAPQMLLQVMALRREGYITDRDMASLLVQYEFVEPGKSIDEVVAAMETQIPRLIGQPDASISKRPPRPPPGSIMPDPPVPPVGRQERPNGRQQ